MKKKIIIGISLIAILCFSLGAIGATFAEKKKAEITDYYNLDKDYYIERIKYVGNGDPTNDLVGFQPHAIIFYEDVYTEKGDLVFEAGEIVAVGIIQYPKRVEDYQTKVEPNVDDIFRDIEID